MAKEKITAKAHTAKLNDLANTFIKKNKDYGSSFEKGLDKRGPLSALIRMEDKMNRLEELIEFGERMVDDESIVDTLMDLANYAIMTAIWVGDTNVSGEINSENFSYPEGVRGLPDPYQPLRQGNVNHTYTSTGVVLDGYPSIPRNWMDRFTMGSDDINQVNEQLKSLNK